MRKKYFTEEERKEARKIEAKKYYDKIRKKPLTEEEKEIIKKERIEKRKQYEKEYYKKNRVKILNKSKEYFKANKEDKQYKNNKRYKERRDLNPDFKLATNIKRNIRSILKKNGLQKHCKTILILGCSYEEFKQHIESQFLPWMNWDNYGKYNGSEGHGWDIDHIIPLSTAKTEDDVIRLNHYTNLQPLCSYINRVIKRDKVITVVKSDNISKITLK